MNEQALDPLPAHIAYMPGSRVRRIGAFIIDMLLLGVVGLSLVYLIPEIFDALGRWSFMTGYLIAGLYFSIFDSTILTGQTIGKKVLNLRVVNRDGATIGLVSAATRFLLVLTPWFLNGRPFPADWLSQTVVLTALSILVFGLGASNLYLFFVTSTKQGLHDLLCRTFVVAVPMTTVTSKSIPKLHIVFVGFLLFLSLLTPSVASHFVSATNQLEEMTAVQREIDKLDRISYSAVTDMTTYNNDSPVTYINIVLVKPLRSIGDSKIAVEACKTIKKFYPRAYDRDFINVQFSYGNDIGIASYWENVQVLRVYRGHLCG